MIEQKRFGSEADVSARYGIGVRQLRELRVRNKGPRYRKVSGKVGRPGGRVLYSFEDVEAWIQAQPCGGDAPEAV